MSFKQSLLKEFHDATKTILKEKLSKNIDTIIKNENRVVRAYNEIANNKQLYKDDWNNLNEFFKHLQGRLEKVFERTKKFTKNSYILGLDENKFYLKKIVSKTMSDNESETNSTDSKSTTIKPSTSSKLETNSKSLISIMEAKKELARTVQQFLPEKFCGEPLKFLSFKNSLDMIEESIPDGLEDYAFKLVKVKLDGLALEYAIDATNLEEIREQLEKRIEIENVTEIKGQFSALNTQKLQINDLVSKINALAVRYERALILSDNMKPKTAKRYAVEKVQEVCLATARTPYVQNSIGNANFETPKEVTTRYLLAVEQDKDIN